MKGGNGDRPGNPTHGSCGRSHRQRARVSGEPGRPRARRHDRAGANFDTQDGPAGCPTSPSGSNASDSVSKLHHSGASCDAHQSERPRLLSRSIITWLSAYTRPGHGGSPCQTIGPRSLRSFDAPLRWRGSQPTPPGSTRSPRRPLASSRSLLRARPGLTDSTHSGWLPLPRKPSAKPSPSTTRRSGRSPHPRRQHEHQHHHGQHGRGDQPR